MYYYIGDGSCRNVTGLQLPGVIDEVYSYDGPLGSVFSEDSISLYLWAPTAQVRCPSSCLFNHLLSLNTCIHYMLLFVILLKDFNCYLFLGCVCQHF